MKSAENIRAGRWELWVEGRFVRMRRDDGTELVMTSQISGSSRTLLSKLVGDDPEVYHALNELLIKIEGADPTQ